MRLHSFLEDSQESVKAIAALGKREAYNLDEEWHELIGDLRKKDAALSA